MGERSFSETCARERVVGWIWVCPAVLRREVLWVCSFKVGFAEAGCGSGLEAIPSNL